MIPIPTLDFVVIQPIDLAQQTASGIYLAEAQMRRTVEKTPNKGIVVRVGPGRLNKKGEHVPMELRAGDEVIYSAGAGSQINYGDESWLLIPERAVLAVVVPPMPDDSAVHESEK